MSEERRVRDPIHGFIRLSSDEAEIVETPAFQRLRGIRQLAMANMVYPGALHTRFDHTLGVFHVTSLLCDVFKFSDEDKRLVKLSALVHDLGHGPFSHVSEGALELFADREKLKERLKPRRSPKTGPWWSPENRPMRKRSGRYPYVRNSLRQREQCLERKKEETSHRARPNWAGHSVELKRPRAFAGRPQPDI